MRLRTTSFILFGLMLTTASFGQTPGMSYVAGTPLRGDDPVVRAIVLAPPELGTGPAEVKTGLCTYGVPQSMDMDCIQEASWSEIGDSLVVGRIRVRARGPRP